MDKVKKQLCRIIIVIYATGITQSKEMDGAWGYWVEKPECSMCLRIRYRYNCTEQDPRIRKSKWNANGLCDAGIYYEKVNRNLKGCFSTELRMAANFNNSNENSSFDMKIMEDDLKRQGLWGEGQTRWTRCSRKAGRRKGSIYNRRGRRARPYFCPSDDKAIWKEQWSYCCAGAWSRWQRITECPKCGPGTTKFVRICGIPGVPLDVKQLSLDGEFLMEWKEENCEPSPCARIENKLKTCEHLCSEGVWEDDSKCRIKDEVLQASQCCMAGYRGMHPSCGPLWERAHNPSEYHNQVVMVATVLGAEGLLIVVTAVVVILYNIGKVPNIFMSMISTCCCHKHKRSPPSFTPSPAARCRDNTKYRAAKGKKVKKVLLTNQEMRRNYSEESQPALDVIDDNDEPK